MHEHHEQHPVELTRHPLRPRTTTYAGILAKLDELAHTAESVGDFVTGHVIRGALATLDADAPADTTPPAISKNAAQEPGKVDTTTPAHKAIAMHGARIRVGPWPVDTVIEIDGAPVTNVERLTLTVAAYDAHPPVLTLVRRATHEEAAARGVLTDDRHVARTVDELTGADTSIDLVGVVELVEESARASLTPAQRTAEALHTFVIQLANDRTGTLAELVRDAERYHAIRRTIDDGAAQLVVDGDGPAVRNGAELDDAADLAHAAYHDEPRRPL